MTAKVRRAGASRTARGAFRFARRGKGSIKVSLRGLRRGRYVLTLRAQDDTGKPGKRVGTRFRLR